MSNKRINIPIDAHSMREVKGIAMRSRRSVSRVVSDLIDFALSMSNVEEEMALRGVRCRSSSQDGASAESA